MNEIENGVKELYGILRVKCYLRNQEFTDLLVKDIELKSDNKNLVLLCESILEILKLEK